MAVRRRFHCQLGDFLTVYVSQAIWAPRYCPVRNVWVVVSVLYYFSPGFSFFEYISKFAIKTFMQSFV